MKSKSNTKRKPLKPRIPLNRKPDGMSDFEWQSALRKQIAEDEQFTIKKTGDEQFLQTIMCTASTPGTVIKLHCAVQITRSTFAVAPISKPTGWVPANTLKRFYYTSIQSRRFAVH